MRARGASGFCVTWSFWAMSYSTESCYQAQNAPATVCVWHSLGGASVKNLELGRLGRNVFACAFLALCAVGSTAASFAATVNVNFTATEVDGNIIQGTFYGLVEGGAVAPTSVVVTKVINGGPIPNYYGSNTVPALPVPVPFPLTLFPAVVGDFNGVIPLTAGGALCSSHSLNNAVCSWGARDFFTVNNPNDSYFSLTYDGEHGIIQFGEVFQGSAYFVGGFFTSSVETTPLPAALPLFVSGLGAIGILGWRRKKKTTAT